MTPEKKAKILCKQVAKLLRDERIRQGLSLNRVSEMAGLSRQTISFLEQGKRIPTLDTLARIAAVLDVKLSQILKNAERK